MIEVNKIINKDCLEAMRDFPDERIDCIVSDPPYSLVSIKKRFGKKNSKEARFGKDGSFNRLGKGFMGKEWDADVPSVEILKEALRVVKSGAFSFWCMTPRQDCLSRFINRLAEAGWNIGMTSLYWVYHEGFPKSANIAKNIAKKQGAGSKGNTFPLNKEYHDYELTKDAKRFDGYYSYNPKPALEVIVVAQKPLSEKTFADQALKNGKGGVWFDPCRVPYKKGEVPNIGGRAEHGRGDGYGFEPLGEDCEANDKGRFPANILVSDEAFGDSSRYYDLDLWFKEKIKELPIEIQRTFPFMQIPKPAKSEKDRNCEELEAKFSPTMNDGIGVKEHNPETATKKHNTHPTTKSIKLMSYLITLGSNKGDVILDPFAGSGTTGIAAEALGRKWIMIEREKEYCEIIEKRIRNIQKKLI